MSKEHPLQNQWELAFERTERLLTDFAKEGLLGWEHRPVTLNFNLQREHLKAFSPEELFVPIFDRPALFSILYQLTFNCGDHAVKAGQEVKISIVSREEDAIIIEVSDNGPGIPQIGEQRVEASALARAPYSSLGIAVKCARGLGGNIFAENIRGEQGEIQGAKFAIRLPRPAKN